MNSNSQKQPFNFFDNSFCLSVSNKVLNGRVDQDLLVEGDTETLMKALVEKMKQALISSDIKSAWQILVNSIEFINE